MSQLYMYEPPQQRDAGPHTRSYQRGVRVWLPHCTIIASAFKCARVSAVDNELLPRPKKNPRNFNKLTRRYNDHVCSKLLSIFSTIDSCIHVHFLNIVRWR